MPLNLTEENTSPFFMFDAEDIKYPAHMEKVMLRMARYNEAVETLELCSDVQELDAWEKEYLDDMRWLGSYKYKSMQHDVKQKRYELTA